MWVLHGLAPILTQANYRQQQLQRCTVTLLTTTVCCKAVKWEIGWYFREARPELIAGLSVITDRVQIQ